MGFERCHPGVNLMFFTAVITSAAVFRHPVFLSVCLTMTRMAGILGMTDMVYDPVIQWKPVTPMAVVLYLGYGTACLMPLGLEVWTDYRFRKARGKL